jgi:hypothetical protein
MHPLHKVISFKIVAPFTLFLKFEDDSERVINFQNILKGKLYGSLADINNFNQVRIDEEIQTIVWPNGADFDPLTLHDWDNYEKEFLLLTENW